MWGLFVNLFSKKHITKYKKDESPIVVDLKELKHELRGMKEEIKLQCDETVYSKKELLVNTIKVSILSVTFFSLVLLFIYLLKGGTEL